MIILEKPYTSEVMLNWLEESQHPVLNNGYACALQAARPSLHLVPDEEAVKRIVAGDRLYVCSENALDWVTSHANCGGACEQLARAVGLCKDKFTMRKALASLDKSLFFRECTMDGLLALDPCELPMPVVVKPTVGFLSFGVHVVKRPAEWLEVVERLHDEVATGTVFPESVIGVGTFVIEGFIFGQEYAVDLYFDQDGVPVILDVMQHDFRDASDTSDHLYYTGPAIMKRAAAPLKAWFAEANRLLGFKNLCVHVELRVSHEPGEDPLDAMEDIANIHFIEFNPLRFAGYCSTDLSYFAYGFRSYEWYLEGKAPSWDDASTDDARTAFIVLESPSKADTIDVKAFERDLCASSDGLELCDMRPLNPREDGLSAFPFVRISAEGDFEAFRQFALDVDADRYAL